MEKVAIIGGRSGMGRMTFAELLQKEFENTEVILVSDPKNELKPESYENALKRIWH